jgi:murein DD-endopeptidase MepM/ murein hydrolase activator NlpD
VSSINSAPEKAVAEQKKQEKKGFPWPAVLSWGVTGLLVTILLLVLLGKFPFSQETGNTEPTIAPLTVALPIIENSESTSAVMVNRNNDADTVIPEGIRQTVIKYTIEEGDSIFSIAKKFDLQPESVIWANDDYFHGNPTVTLSIGDVLNIPPTNGVLYTWKDGDTLKKVAYDYKSTIQKIIAWPANDLDAADPVIPAGALIMIPDGSTVINEWIEEVAYTPRSGVTQRITGPGGCDVTTGYGAVGSTVFIWPSSQHAVSGWDFSGFHKGIDIASYVGDPVWASDNGTVVYAGWNDTGYGYMVMIDHNNGYQSLYAHLSAVFVTCGQNIYQGTVIGSGGSTGNSTGPHLHFEIRSNGAFINPWYVLQ